MLIERAGALIERLSGDDRQIVADLVNAVQITDATLAQLSERLMQTITLKEQLLGSLNKLYREARAAEPHR